MSGEPKPGIAWEAKLLSLLRLYSSGLNITSNRSPVFSFRILAFASAMSLRLRQIRPNRSRRATTRRSICVRTSSVKRETSNVCGERVSQTPAIDPGVRAGASSPLAGFLSDCDREPAAPAITVVVRPARFSSLLDRRRRVRPPNRVAAAATVGGAGAEGSNAIRDRATLRWTIQVPGTATVVPTDGFQRPRDASGRGECRALDATAVVAGLTGRWTIVAAGEPVAAGDRKSV